MNASAWARSSIRRRLILALARRIESWSLNCGAEVRRVVLKAPPDLPGDEISAELRHTLAAVWDSPVHISIHPVPGPLQVWSIESG